MTVPTGMRVAPTSYAKLEEVAKSFFPLLPKEKGQPYMISAWRVLEQTLPSADFDYCILPDAEMKGCAAYTIPDLGQVVFSESVYEGLFEGRAYSRSTVIHELSHILQQHHVTLHRDTTLGKHKFYEDSEWQAKALTAAIMMPVDVCKKARDSHELSEICGTSIEAASYRLENVKKRGLK